MGDHIPAEVGREISMSSAKVNNSIASNVLEYNNLNHKHEGNNITIENTDDDESSAGSVESGSSLSCLAL